MSARIESAPVGRFNVGAVVIAVVVALGVGGLVGLMATRAGEERPAAVTTPEGRQLAETFSGEEAPTTAKPSSTQPRVRGWDPQKLEAMEGRQLAEQLGAEDPIKPHTPKHSPKRTPAG